MFVAHLEDIRARVGRPVAFVLIAHTNKGGQVAGAWEGATDTLAHVQAFGNGRSRIHWQKARWAGELHGTTWHLLWRDGETFELEDRPEISESDVIDGLLAYVERNPGTSWRKAETDKSIPGGATKKRDARDLLFKHDRLKNNPKGKTMRLYLPDDPELHEQVCLPPDTPQTHPSLARVATDQRGVCPCLP